jgi:tetratricopeptide (TPR) repeat protein
MRKALFTLLIALAVVTTYGQDLSVGLQAKNDGNEAYRNKNYVEAIKYYEVYLNSGEEEVADDINTKTLYVNSFRFAANDFLGKKEFDKAFGHYEKYFNIEPEQFNTDGKSLYEMAYCANQINKTDMALSLYQKCIELNYRPDISTLYIAGIYRKADDEAKMSKILKEALEKYPQSRERSKMIAMITAPLLKEASIPFNAGNELAKAASTGTPDEYLASMTKAVQKFEEAIPLFEEILNYDPQNNQASSLINACRDNIKAFREYQSTLKK